MLPFGGYVIPAVESDQDYFEIPPSRRIVFALGGPLMNLALGYALFVAAAVAGGAEGPILSGALARTQSTLTAMLAAVPALFAQPESLSSVVGIVAEGARWTADGLAAILAFSAFMSLNFALFNLLPLPPLDGGKVLLCLLEIVHGRATRLHVPLNVAGWVLLAGLFLYVTALDLARLSA